MRYYISINNEQIGPLSLKKAGKYKILPTTKVWREDQEMWKEAIEFEELHQFFGSPKMDKQPMHFCRRCGNPISTNSRFCPKCGIIQKNGNNFL
jgi:rubrerythrin